MAARSDRRNGPIPFWEQAYGMTLDDVTRYLPGAHPPGDSVIVARQQAARSVANGGTVGTSLRLHGTRLDVGGRALLLLTLAMPTGGYRMVAVDGASGQVRQMWRASGCTRAKASRRHYAAVQGVRARHGATIVRERGVERPPVPNIGTPDVPSAPWDALRLRLIYDGADGDAVGQVARFALERLDGGDYGGTITELLDAARADHAPLANAASSWLRMLGYDAVHALIPQGPDLAYASELLHYDHELATR